MKNAIILLSLSMLFSMCQNNHKIVEETQLKNDSLQQLVNQKDSSLYTFLNTFSLIESNLQTIKEKEGIISTTANDDIEHYKTKEQKINDDIGAIYNLMTENKEALKNLENKLRDSKTNEKNLQSIIATLNQRLLEKDAEILALQTKLKEMDITLAKLNYKIDTLDLQNRIKKDIIELQGQTLKTGYYIMGSHKELKEMGIIKSNGLFGKAQITDDFNKDHFAQIDILTDTIFRVQSKKIDIISIHPNESYTLSTEEINNTLTISEPWDFWSVSKYMVIVIK